MNTNIKAKIDEIVKALGARTNGADYIHTPLADLGLDSLKTMDLILSIEEAFGIQIPDENLNSKYLNSVALIAELVERLCAGR